MSIRSNSRISDITGGLRLRLPGVVRAAVGAGAFAGLVRVRCVVRGQRHRSLCRPTFRVSGSPSRSVCRRRRCATSTRPAAPGTDSAGCRRRSRPRLRRRRAARLGSNRNSTAIVEGGRPGSARAADALLIARSSLARGRPGRLGRDPLGGGSGGRTPKLQLAVRPCALDELRALRRRARGGPARRGSGRSAPGHGCAVTQTLAWAVSESRPSGGLPHERVIDGEELADRAGAGRHGSRRRHRQP